MNIQSVSYVNIDDFGFDGDFLSGVLDVLDVSFGDSAFTMVSAFFLTCAVNVYNNSLDDDMLDDGVNEIAYDNLCKLDNGVYINLENPKA